MNEVRGGGQVAAQFLIVSHLFKDFGRGAIAVFTNQSIDLTIFTELLDTWSNYYQAAAVADQHTRAVDSFVGQPSPFVLGGVHCHDDRLGSAIDNEAVHLCG